MQGNDFFQCPGCQKTLIATTRVCQYCGADTAKLSRKVEGADDGPRTSFQAAGWVVTVYYLLSALWIVGGIFGAAKALYDGMHHPPIQFLGESIPQGMNMGDIVNVIIGIIQVVLGLGMAFRVSVLRSIVNVISYLVGFWGVFMLILGMTGIGSSSVAWIIIGQGLIDMVIGGGTIWILAETDSKMYVAKGAFRH